jgi:TPR repeat protein
VAILAVGIGVYLVAASRTDDARSRIAALEKQVQDQELAEKARLRTEQQKQEQDLADAARLRLAQQKADDEARQRREREPQVQVVPDKMRADENAKRVATERSPPDGTRVADRKRTDVPARPTSPAAGNVPVAVPSTSSPQASQAVEPAAVQVAAAAPPPAVPAPAKAAATRTAAEQFADADQAWEARRYPEAIALLRPMADTGNARAQTRLGDAYLDGRGLPRDDAAAGAWYEKAALQGDTNAQVKLAALYASGNGALRNINLAYVWFGTAARLGSGAARIEQERVAASLQPAERAQADRLIESSVARMSKGR